MARRVILTGSSVAVFKDNASATVCFPQKTNKKGRACTRPFKRNPLVRCQYIRGQGLEDNFIKRPEGYKPTFFQICDPLPAHRSVSGPH